ncbi:MAG: Rieske (2Fe-2S) protein, partial [Candidatus Limnocylindrales bacterium]
RHAWDEPEPEWVRLDVAEVPENELTKATGGGRDFLLVREGSTFHALDAVCSHAGGPLDEGELHGDEVTCPWHGSKFRITDGQVRRGPATFPLPDYEVRVSDAGVEVRSRAD